MLGGHPAGQIAWTEALVEYKDGKIRRVSADSIKFESGPIYEHPFFNK